MGVRVTKSSGVIDHPEGWYPFKIVGGEEVDGQYGTQVKYLCQSGQSNDEGEPIVLFYYVKPVLSTHEKSKFTNLVVACGLAEDREDACEGDWDDSDILIGKKFEGRVDHVEGKNGGTFPTIGAVRKIKLKSSKRQEVDPFEDE